MYVLPRILLSFQLPFLSKLLNAFLICSNFCFVVDSGTDEGSDQEEDQFSRDYRSPYGNGRDDTSLHFENLLSRSVPIDIPNTATAAINRIEMKSATDEDGLIDNIPVLLPS